jgi:putative ABC transport system substrate-binding protein
MRVRSLGRRELIAILGGAAALRPLAARAQQPEPARRVGVLIPWPESDPVTERSVTAFAQALGRFGWVEGKNIRLDYRFAAGDAVLFETYAAELVGLSPDAILAGTPPALAALRQQPRTIPIVFVLVVDPVGLGFVQSLARPGGNLTGFGAFDAPIIGKWLQLLKEIAPGVTRVAIIFNPDTAPYAPLFNRVIETAAPSFGIKVTQAPVRGDAAIEEAIAAQAHEPGGGLINLPDIFTATHRDVTIAAAAHHGLPLMGPSEFFAKSGGLISYWFDPVDVHAQAASYIDRILHGASPADLPVQQPTFPATNTPPFRHTGEGRCLWQGWVPACAGKTRSYYRGLLSDTLRNGICEALHWLMQAAVDPRAWSVLLGAVPDRRAGFDSMKPDAWLIRRRQAARLRSGRRARPRLFAASDRQYLANRRDRPYRAGRYR